MSLDDPYQPTTTPHAQSQSGVGFSVAYLKTPPGIIKASELLLGMIVFICAQAAYYYRGIGWVSFVGISAFLTTLILLLFHLFNIVGRNGRFMFRFIIPDFIYTGIYCALFVIAAIVGAASAPGNAGAGAAAFFSFLSAALYAVDTFWQYRIFKAEREQDAGLVNNAGADVDQQLPPDMPPKYEP